MGMLGTSREEEEALREAQQSQQLAGSMPSSQSLSSESRHSLITTDYESAYSHIEPSDAEQDHESIATIQPQQNTEQVQEDEQVLETFSPEASVRDQSEINNDDTLQPITLKRTRSLASFNDPSSKYGPPTQEFDPTQPQSEAFELALQRTISRKSILSTKNDKKQLKEDDDDDDSNDSDEIDPTTLTWDGPNDKDDPKNWPSWMKWAATMSTASICLEVSFGSSLYVCGVPDLMVELGSSQELALSGLTFYLLGLAFGPALAAPISELFGRRVVYCFSLPVSMLFTMGVGLSGKIREVLVLRFFAGFFASPAMAVAGGTIADIWDFEMMGLAMGGFCLAPFMGPVLGPIIGGFVAEDKGWKWTMWVNLMFAGLILFPVLLTPETYKPVILKARAKKRGLKLAKSKVGLGAFLKMIFFVTLITPMKMLFVEPIVIVFSIYIAFVFAILFGFFEAYPIIFRGVYGMSLGISGLAFLGICVGFLIGTAIYIYADRFILFKKNLDGTRGPRDDEGKLIIEPPETRLFLAKIGGIMLPISLFWLGWSARESVHWICPIIAGVPFGAGLILIFFTTITYFSMTYPPLSLASALAANNLLRYVVASVFPLFCTQFFESATGIGWAASVFGFVALAMCPIPWIFQKYGPALRMKSQYGYSAMFKKQQMEAAKAQEQMEKEMVESGTSDEHV